MRYFSSLLLVCAVAVSAAACSPVVKTSGYKPDTEVLANLKPGVHNRDDVSEMLGSPSSVSGFKPETWFYVFKQTERLAFLEPELKDSQVVSLTFDARGILSDVVTQGPDTLKQVTPIERKTPTVGEEPGFVDQMIGNIGRFNK